jgi:uncharacterized protein YqeY
MFFFTNQKELPLVAFLLQEKIHFFSKGFPFPSGAKKNIRFQIFLNQQSKINNLKSKINMSLSTHIMDEMKTAMRAKDTVALEALRAIKSEILLAQTATGSKEEITEADEIKILQKLVKMRKDSAAIFTEQNRPDLAEPELAQIVVIEKFLPAQLSEAEVEAIIAKIIAETGASGIASMGKVMGLASGQIGGQAEGKTISSIVKKLLV